jgi:hypothetical protein
VALLRNVAFIYTEYKTYNIALFYNKSNELLTKKGMIRIIFEYGLKMKPCVFISALGLLFFTNSCSVKNLQFIKKQEITYETGFSVRDPYGIFYNHEDKKEYFYIADMGETGKLLFFTVDGKRVMEIPTDSLSDWRNTTAIAVKNLDTVVFFMEGSPGESDDRIVLTDRTGRRLKIIELENIPPDENNVSYSFQKTEMNKNTFFDGNSVFLSASPVDMIIGSDILGSKNNALMLRTYIPIKHKSHCLLKYNIYTGTYQYALSAIWRTVCPDSNHYIVGFRHAVENNTVFMYSFSGNTVYLFDAATFKLKRKLEITSPHTKIGIPPATLEERINASYSRQLYLHGLLTGLIYDKYNRLYYVIIRHGAENDFLADKAPFSIQIYNKKCNKLLAEHVFDSKEYIPKSCMVTSQGLLIQHSSAKKDDNPTEVKFDLFKIKKILFTQ